MDALLGLVLATVFISVLSYTRMQSSELFSDAKGKDSLIETYTSHSAEFEGLKPGESRSATYPAGSSTVMIQAAAREYGNEMVETRIYVSDAIGYQEFSSVRAATSSEAASTPLCSADPGAGAVVGSYRYLHPAANSPPSLSISQIMLPISASLPLTDLIVRNGIAMVAADSSTASDPDIILFDIHDPRSPSLISMIDTGPGMASIASSGDVIYGAAASTAAQLHILKLDSLTAPRLIKRYKLPLPEASTSPPLGSAVALDGSYALLGTEKWDGQELSIIDVRDPADPLRVAGLEIGSKVNDIKIHAHRAYVSSADQYQFRILDVSDPRAISAIFAFSPSGWSRQEGKAAGVFESRLAFGRTSGGFNIAADKELFSFQTGSSSPEADADVSGGIYGIVRDRRALYAISRTLDKELQVYDSSLSSSTARYYPLPVQPQRLACDGDRLYALAKNAPTIYEIRLHSD